ncbi:MAG TPA: hypothetical protein VNU46_04100, partial [Gemmatimonadaceae bacterium]|nr:hypothetical protein [Gemmatimonadaceae bacterium]
SVGASDAYQRDTDRLVRLAARQLGEDRQPLTSDQRPEFDRRARVWIDQRRREGYAVTIAGVQQGMAPHDSY